MESPIIPPPTPILTAAPPLPMELPPSRPSPTLEECLRRFLAYPFEKDLDYQQGLADIVATGALDGMSDEERTDVLLRSQVYYFNRQTREKLTVDDVRLARTSASEPTDTAAPDAGTLSTASTYIASEETKTLTFAELKELIEHGRTDQIPNNRKIPDDLNAAPPSESNATVRKKPWEL